MERRKLRPHQSVNSASISSGGTLNKSQSTGELANRNENGNGNVTHTFIIDVDIQHISEFRLVLVDCSDVDYILF